MNAPHWRVDEVPLAPVRGAADADLVAAVELANECEKHALGSDALREDPAAAFAELTDPWIVHRFSVVRDGDRIVGRSVLALAQEEHARTATFDLHVHPEWRRRGIGSALLAAGEREARRDGRTVMQCWVTHRSVEPGEALVVPPTGFGRLAETDPGVRFLTRHGWTLQQIYRISEIRLPVRAVAPSECPDDGYSILAWTGATPDRWTADLAALLSRMQLEAPQAGIEVDGEEWTAERVRERDERVAASGQLLVAAVARYAADGRLVGFTDLCAPADRSLSAQQGDTLVAPEHRGHALGMRMKAALHEALRTASPETPRAITFNAEENRPMLRVNEALGYRPIGYEGAWSRRLDPERTRP